MMIEAKLKSTKIQWLLKPEDGGQEMCNNKMVVGR